MQNNLTYKNRKLLIAIVSPGWPLNSFPNGIVAYTYNLLFGLKEIAEPIVLAAQLSIPEVRDRIIDLSGIEVSRSLWQKLFDKVLFRLTGRYVKKIQYQRNISLNANRILKAFSNLDLPIDILEIEESFGTAIEIIQKTKIPVVTRLHGPWFIHGPIMKMESEPDYQLRVFYEGEAIKNSNGVTSPCLDVLQKVRDFYGIDLPYAKVIPNPVCEVDPSNQLKYDSQAKPFILVVARFDLHKGGDLIIDAFKIIAQKNKTVELVFVGPDRGITIDGVDLQFDAYVEKFISDESIKKRIQFLGHCDQTRITELRKIALVTVMCSRYETFSISLVEALSAGCPVVACNVGAIKEIIFNDFNGILAEPESSISIADKVLMLINDPEKMQRLSKNAIEDCKKRFSPEAVAAQTLDYYHSVLDRTTSSV